MVRTKISVSFDKSLLARLDRQVKCRPLRSRSQAIQIAVRGYLGIHRSRRLAKELAKFDPKAEARLADLGLEEDLKSWPK